MKAILLFAAALILSIDSFCQDKGFVSINLGPAIPMGDFGSTALNNEDAGFAKTGYFADLSFGYKLGTNIGVGATLRTQSNGIDKDAILSFYQIFGISEEITIKADPYSCNGLLGGLYGSFPIKGKTSFDFRGFVGFMSCERPEITMSITAFGFTESFTLPGASGTSFAYLLGAGLKIDVSNRVCLNTGIDFLSTSPEFKLEDPDTGEVDKYTQSISTINIGVGVGLRL